MRTPTRIGTLTHSHACTRPSVAVVPPTAGTRTNVLPRQARNPGARTHKHVAGVSMLLPDQTYEQGTGANADANDDNDTDNDSTSGSAAAHVGEPPRSRSRSRRSRSRLTAVRGLQVDDAQPVAGNGGDVKTAPNGRKITVHKTTQSPKVKNNTSPAHQSTTATVSGALRTLFQLTFSPKSSRPTDATDVPLRVSTPENFGRTSEFFNNIPDYLGDPYRPFSLAQGAVTPDVQRSRRPEAGDRLHAHAGRAAAESADVLKECEQFLHTHRIRSDFFCRYRKAVL